MLCHEDIKIETKSQGFEAKQLMISPNKDRAVTLSIIFEDRIPA